MNIKLLDCTLRDGGYVNNWNFGNNTIASIFQRLVCSKIDIIEIGFLDDRVSFDPDKTIQPNIQSFENVFYGLNKETSKVVLMIDYGTCNINNVYIETQFVDGIRLIFKKPDMFKAIEYGKLIKNKGFELFLQLVSITDYSDYDIIKLCETVNDILPETISMVDTYGLMHKNEMLHYYDLLDHNLNKNISIGYHSHNNFQLAYANTIEMLNKYLTRNIVIDGTVYGMGKSAGNAPLELLAMHLNENCNKNYNIDQILEIIDINILNIYEKNRWGYSTQYFLAALNDCHPNYISYLFNKKTLSIKAINNIVQKINENEKLHYNPDIIDSLYIDFQKQFSYYCNEIDSLIELLKDKIVLLLGPGKTLLEFQQYIQNYIMKINPIIISINCLPDAFNINFVFLCNSKRYDMLYKKINNKKDNIKIIATSNITPIFNKFEYHFDYEKLLDNDSIISDNALAMILNLLEIIKPIEIILAGFDGFQKKMSKNYYEEYMEFVVDYERLAKVNKALSDKLKIMMKEMDIKFITPSLYESNLFIDELTNDKYNIV